MLKITDLSKLKVTNLKPWSLRFTYDDIKYFAKADGWGYDSETVLYRKIEGKVEYISKCCGNVINDLDMLFYNDTRVYQQFNKKGLVKALMRTKLVEGVEEFEREIVEDNKRIEEIRVEICRLSNMERELRFKEHRIMMGVE